MNPNAFTHAGAPVCILAAEYGLQPPPCYSAPGVAIDDTDEWEMFSDLPPTLIAVSLTQACGLPPIGPDAAAGVGSLSGGSCYCVAVVGSITRVFEAVGSNDREARFYCSSLSFPLHQRKVSLGIWPPEQGGAGAFQRQVH